ncbi:hypothetical protein ACLKA7_001480 [Drosophila subpalustris]
MINDRWSEESSYLSLIASLEEKLQLTCSCVKAIGVPEGNVYSKISHDERKKKLEKQAELQIEEQKQIPVDQAGET